MIAEYKGISFAKFIINYCNVTKRYINKYELFGVMAIVQKEFIRRGFLAFEDEIWARPIGPWIPEVNNNFFIYNANPIFETFENITFYKKDSWQALLVIDIIDSLYSLDYFEFIKLIKGTAYQEAYKIGKSREITIDMYKREIEEEN